MEIGGSVSNGTPWDTRGPPRGNFSLTKYGVSTWWTTYFPISRGTEIKHTNENLKDMESFATGDSNNCSCTEAPQIGASGRDPVEQGAGQTPLVWGGGPSPSNLSSENLEDSASEPLARTVVVLPKSGRGGLGSRRLLWGTLAVANLGLLQAVSYIFCRSPVHPGSSGVNIRREEGSHRAQASDSCWQGALPRGPG